MTRASEVVHSVVACWDRGIAGTANDVVNCALAIAPDLTPYEIRQALHAGVEADTIATRWDYLAWIYWEKQ